LAAQSRWRTKAGLGLVRLVKLYNDLSPVRKGKLALGSVALRVANACPPERVVKTFDGRRVYADLAEPGMYTSVYFAGEFEPAVTQVISAVVRPGDVCLDIGANFGWYTTLLHSLAGASGAVHAFEPVPRIYRTLERNLALAGSPPNVRLNNVALGDEPGTAVMHIFAGLPNGHTSLSTQGREDFTTVESPLIVLDSYLAEHRVGTVNFIKMDVEGAELMCLRGAESLLRQPVPPIWMIEMAEATTRGFGYLPNELVMFLRTRADYEFYAVDEYTREVFPIEGFASDEIGANVLCVPAGQYRDRLAAVAQRAAGVIAKVPVRAA
jgi:FkbM family methyltransferase